MSNLEGNPQVLKEMPVAPSGPTEAAIYKNLLATIERQLEQMEGVQIELADLAAAADVSLEQVKAFFPVPAAATVALAEHYVQLAAGMIFVDHSGDPEANWEGVVHEVLKRGRTIYKDHPVAKKIRLGAQQSAGLRYLLVKSNQLLAERLSEEIHRLFIVPDQVDLVEELAHGIIISDALLSVSFQLHGEITDEIIDVAERAVTGYLVQSLGQRLKIRNG